MGVFMLFIKQIVEDEESYKLLYAFTKKNNTEWKQQFLMSSLLQGLIPLKQGNLSDYEYFKKFHKWLKEHEDFPSQDYMLMENNIPITSIYIIMRTNNIADISFITDKNHLRKGYATKALTMIEQILFQNTEIMFTTILDLTPNKITSKIALKSGYFYNEDTKYFIKANPNINLEEQMADPKIN